MQRYLTGEGSSTFLGKETGLHPTIIENWIKKYNQYGEAVFDIKTKNASYTKAFKEKVVVAYLNAEGSYNDLSLKYNVAKSVIFQWVKVYNNHIELEDYIPGGDIYMTKSRKVNQTERLEIVKHCIEHELNYKITAKVYEVPYANVYNWVKKYKALGEDGLSDKRGRHKKDDEVDEVTLLKRELKKLEHEYEMSQLEVRLLKKAEEIERRRYTEQVNTKLNMKQSKK